MNSYRKISLFACKGSIFMIKSQKVSGFFYGGGTEILLTHFGCMVMRGTSISSIEMPPCWNVSL